MTKNNKETSPRLIDLSRIFDRRGNLSVVEESRDFPCNIRRVYWVYDVPGGERRGGHAHKEQTEMLVAVSGSFTVTTDDGLGNKSTFFLNHPYRGLLLPTGIWRTLEDFSSGSVCLVMNSDYYKEEDYIRNYREFLKYKKELSDG